MAERILVVEDESTLCHNIERLLGRAGHTVTAVETGEAALAEIEAHTFDLVITDLRLPDADGLTVLDRVRRVAPETVVLIMTAYASVDSAVEALRRGAQDYMLKPLSLADLSAKVQHFSEYRRLGRENARLRSLVRGEADPVALLRRGGRAMQELCDLLDKVAPSTSNVLVLGESGTGKELVARAVHDLSPRRDGPFVSINVRAMPDNLVESTLFGHERGAFTGADKRREGLFRAASGGTLFLDEIGELAPTVQAKLLRALETKEVLPVGADRGVRVDVRIVAATNRDLAAMTTSGRFRQDLFYRLRVVELFIPPLRDRPEDIAALALHFIGVHAKAQRKEVNAIAPDALALLRGDRWRGNVRELSNVIERAVILCSDDTITPMDLPVELGSGTSDAPPVSTPSAAVAPAEEEDPNLERAVLAFQRKHIARVLRRAQGNREAAAKMLGLSPATLYRHLTRLGLKGSRGEAGDEE
jgi:DNA-binding NtrC family response regulator